MLPDEHRLKFLSLDFAFDCMLVLGTSTTEHENSHYTVIMMQQKIIQTAVVKRMEIMNKK
jgi:hypothetical protein